MVGREVYGETFDAFDALVALLRVPEDKRDQLSNDLDGWTDLSNPEYWWAQRGKKSAASFKAAERHVRSFLQVVQAMTDDERDLLSDVWNGYFLGGPPPLNPPISGPHTLEALVARVTRTEGIVSSA